MFLLEASEVLCMVDASRCMEDHLGDGKYSPGGSGGADRMVASIAGLVRLLACMADENLFRLLLVP